MWVDEVMTAGWASLARVAAGDLLMAIDGTPTPDVETTKRLLQTAAEKKVRRLLLFLRRGAHTRFAELEPNWASMNGDPQMTENKPKSQ